MFTRRYPLQLRFNILYLDDIICESAFCFYSEFENASSIVNLNYIQQQPNFFFRLHLCRKFQFYRLKFIRATGGLERFAAKKKSQ